MFKTPLLMAWMAPATGIAMRHIAAAVAQHQVQMANIGLNPLRQTVASHGCWWHGSPGGRK